MADTDIELPEDSTLNVEGIPNVPVCPICTSILEGVHKSYSYRRINPDTRWFFCPECECHLGYHRMKGRWKVDPYDLDVNNKIREHFGLDPI